MTDTTDSAHPAPTPAADQPGIATGDTLGEALTGHDGGHDVEVRELAEVPAQEVILRSIMVLMSAAAEKLGLSQPDPTDSPHLDLDEARKLITALAGMVSASAEYLGAQAGVVRDGLQGLQKAFREVSSSPDAPGQGPGEKFTGPVF